MPKWRLTDPMQTRISKFWNRAELQLCNLGESGNPAGEASPAPSRADSTAEDTAYISCHSLSTGHSLPDGSKSSGPAAKPGLQNMSLGTDKKSARLREVETWQQPVTWKQANL